ALRRDRVRVRRGARGGDGRRRGGAHGPAGSRVGVDGDGRAARHALDRVGGRARGAARAADGDAEADRAGDGRVTRVSLAATASYLPERWMPAAEVAVASGVPEQVLVEKFALRGKHIAGT